MLGNTLEYRCPETDKYLPLFDEMLEWNGTKEDWKNPFNAVIPTKRFKEYSDAAEFFTGARLEIILVPTAMNSAKCLVYCKGYYIACGA